MLAKGNEVSGAGYGACQKQIYLLVKHHENNHNQYSTPRLPGQRNRRDSVAAMEGGKELLENLLHHRSTQVL